ncbi:hypothetical protein NLJ89_g871 [Agrocybe chaxingu]|uniref:RING-type domain-containing protein n=1 Tax=Agrocybe chaxingu TaxID=84603 RepID=A0A9W8TE85_9AGAR|nr:hypothetical protein NLJ89_g871 [Agrocybe chaxingu]
MPPRLFPTVLVLAVSVCAYIPALPTNSTSDAIAGGLNVTDISKLHMRWFSNGSYSQDVSYQLAGYGSNGMSKVGRPCDDIAFSASLRALPKGVLVHFSEEKVSNMTPPTLTPWIALVSCDRNATNSSMDEDIFTLARDKGAVSAVLYSLHSVACVINPEYSDPATFDQVFDIFSTQSPTSSHLIEYQFGQLGGQNESIYDYESQQLNNSREDVMRSTSQNYAVSSGYLLAILQAYNSTGGSSDPVMSGTSSAPAEPGNSGSPNTALAMIILYAITGCVSALFCIVIISGAIRAIRHPERYGPRARLDGPPAEQSKGTDASHSRYIPHCQVWQWSGCLSRLSTSARGKDVESPPAGTNIEMDALQKGKEISSPEAAGTSDPQSTQSSPAVAPTNTTEDPSPGEEPGSSRTATDNNPEPDGVAEGSPRNLAVAASNHVDHDDIVPASIGRDTCPICIVNFEEGDDIRVLLCEGKHCFHQQCVDPWLLKLSSSCPICRHDFLALENMLSGHTDEEADGSEQLAPPRGHNSGGRFSRYLRFARHRHRRRRGDDNDPTDPYMPTAPETSLQG